MTDRYLFKAKRIDNGEWVEGYVFDNGISENRRMFVGGLIITDHKGAWFDMYDVDLDFCEIDESTICQFTGLYDGTKWEDLTEEEKQAFYEEVCSEDGKSIKYQNVEDVKHLWKGKKIWENDVVKEESCGYVGVVKYVDCEYLIDWNDFPYIRRDMMFWVEERGLKVIGTTLDNPELLGG